MVTRYQDFEIIITRRDDGALHADLGTAPDGRKLTQPVPIILPDDQIAWAEAGQGRKSEAELAQLGQRLFDAIFIDELREKWHECLGVLHDNAAVGLRLRFSTQFNALTEVPLELLCSRVIPTRDFLALNSRMPIVRSPRSGRLPYQRVLSWPLRMLIIIANYKLAEIDVEAERTNLEVALANLLCNGKLTVDYLGVDGYPQADFDTLHHTVAQAQFLYDIIHFIGHGVLLENEAGEAEGVLHFVDPYHGRKQEVYASDLASITASNGVHLVVLQACEGARDGATNAFQGTAQQLIASGLPAAVAMQWSVDKDVAAQFCAQLYNFWLDGTGMPLERAVTEARIAVRRRFHSRSAVWALPVVFSYLESSSVLAVEVASAPDPGQVSLQGSSGFSVETTTYSGMAREPMTKQYNLKNIRTLLEKFKDEELRYFCYDESGFRPVYNKFTQATGKATIINWLLEYADPKLQIEVLLTWAREHNPATYEKYQPYDDITISPSTSSGVHGKSQSASLPDTLTIESPYGTMRPTSKFYIERTVDAICTKMISPSDAITLFIQAPRQMGKSSLIRRVLYRANQEYGKKAVFIDFQEFPKQHFSDEKSFLIEFCLSIGNELGVPPAIKQYWRGPQTNSIKCRRYMSDYIIPWVNESFILALDELDRIFASPFRDNFFGMLRTWHNYRAHNENFTKLTLLLSSSTEPYLFIESPHQSPFNVAEVIMLQDFTRTEVEELNRRHDAPLKPEQIDDLMNLLGGHPFLTRLALYQLATKRINLDTLLAQATADTGPFGDHLRYYLWRVLEQPELKEALTLICRYNEYEENQIFHRLKGIGLIRQADQQVILRNDLYTRYFKERLSG